MKRKKIKIIPQNNQLENFTEKFLKVAKNFSELVSDLDRISNNNRSSQPSSTTSKVSVDSVTGVTNYNGTISFPANPSNTTVDIDEVGTINATRQLNLYEPYWRDPTFYKRRYGLDNVIANSDVDEKVVFRIYCYHI